MKITFYMMIAHSKNHQYRMVYSGFKNQIRKRIKLFDQFCRYHGTESDIVCSNVKIKVSRKKKCINTAVFFDKTYTIKVADLLNKKTYHISENPDSWRVPAGDLYFNLKKDLEFNENEEELE